MRQNKNSSKCLNRFVGVLHVEQGRSGIVRFWEERDSEAGICDTAIRKV